MYGAIAIKISIIAFLVFGPFMISCKKHNNFGTILKLTENDFSELRLPKYQFIYYYLNDNSEIKTKDFERDFIKGFNLAAMDEKNKTLISEIIEQPKFEPKTLPPYYSLPKYEWNIINDGYNLYNFLYNKKAELLFNLSRNNFDKTDIINDIYTFYFPEEEPIEQTIASFPDDFYGKSREEMVDELKKFYKEKVETDKLRKKSKFKLIINKELESIQKRLIQDLKKSKPVR